MHWITNDPQVKICNLYFELRNEENIPSITKKSNLCCIKTNCKVRKYIPTLNYSLYGYQDHLFFLYFFYSSLKIATFTKKTKIEN